MSKKVISFSLWGDQAKYLNGFLANLLLARTLYPGWEVWCFCDFVALRQVRGQAEQISGGPVTKFILMSEVGSWSGMFWRFLPLHMKSVDMFLSRDADSRLSIRERIAVHYWEVSKKAFHIMRDHPYHNVPILGGMWGCRVGATIDLGVKVPWNTLGEGNYYQVDQDFLAKKVYPLVRNHSLVHDPFFEKLDFPSKRVLDEFVGESLGSNDSRDEIAVNALKAVI